MFPEEGSGIYAKGDAAHRYVEKGRGGRNPNHMLNFELTRPGTILIQRTAVVAPSDHKSKILVVRKIEILVVY